MKTHTLLFALICLLILPACDHYYKDATRTSYASFGTDSDAVVVDGPLPVLVGVVPIYDKKGRITGQRGLYTAGDPTGPKVGFARFGGNQSTVATRALAELRNGYLGWIAGETSKAADANKAANEARQIDAAAAAQQGELANQAARDAQRHAEKMAEFEAPPTP